MFENENKMFLEQYPDDTTQIDFYIEQVIKVFNTIGIDNDWSVCGIRENVYAWYYNKQPLFNLLRNNPNWNEEAKAIVFLHDEIRDSSLMDFQLFSANLQDYVENKAVKYGISINSEYDTALSIVKRECSKTISQETADELNALKIFGTFNGGTKRSRVINTIHTKTPVQQHYYLDTTKFEDKHEEGDRSFQSYNKLFAKVADATNPITITRITVLSCNICDYLLMSNGNSWSSCHFINSNGAYHGCYKAGTLSYANDETSMIFYTLPASYTGTEWFMEKKITRQVYCYQNGILLQSRLYPKDTHEGYDNYRAVVQDIIAKCLGVSNLWKKKTVSDSCDVDEFVRTSGHSLHYRDYEEFPDEVVFSLNKELYQEGNYIDIGAESYCVDCGESMSDENAEELQCSGCINNTHYCARCGNRVEYAEDLHYIDGEYYCEDCCFWCEYHDEWELGDNTEIYFTDLDEYRTVCDYSLDNYSRCDHCGDYIWYNDNLHYVSEIYEYLCNECYEGYLENKKEEENEDEVA